MTVDLSMFDDATAEEVESLLAEMHGAPFRDVLGPAYDDIEEWALTTMMGLPDDGTVLAKMEARWGADKAADLALGMALLIQAQARGQDDASSD